MYYNDITSQEAVALLKENGYAVLLYGGPMRVEELVRILRYDSDFKGLNIPEKGNPMDPGCIIERKGHLCIPCYKGWNPKQSGDSAQGIYLVDEGIDGVREPEQVVNIALSVRQDFLYPDSWYVICASPSRPGILFVGQSKEESLDWAERARQQLESAIESEIAKLTKIKGV